MSKVDPELAQEARRLALAHDEVDEGHALIHCSQWRVLRAFVLSASEPPAQPEPLPPRPYSLRDEVFAFAQAMEEQLRANDHKPGWKSDKSFDLFHRLREEVDELQEVLTNRTLSSHAADAPERILKEAADVANFAMMVADVCGALPRRAPETERYTSWLVERGQAANHTPTVWWRGNPIGSEPWTRYWTENANEAARFATKEVASEAAAGHLHRDSYTITNHAWLAGRAPAATGKKWRATLHYVKGSGSGGRPEYEIEFIEPVPETKEGAQKA